MHKNYAMRIFAVFYHLNTDFDRATSLKNQVRFYVLLPWLLLTEAMYSVKSTDY